MKAFRRLVPVLAGPLLAVFLLGMAPRALLAEEEHPLTVAGVPTNLGLAHELTSRVAQLLLPELSDHMDGACLHSRAGAEHSGNTLMDLALAEAGRQSGLRVAAEEGLCGSVLEFSILELRIAYTGIDRSAIGMKKEIERHAACVVAGRVLDAETGEELASTQQEILLSDRFPYELEGLVTSDRYPFTAPTLSERNWSKSVEPFVVTALVSGLVYLFFSNQSSE